MQESSFLKDEGLLILSKYFKANVASRIKRMSFMLHLIKFSLEQANLVDKCPTQTVKKAENKRVIHSEMLT